MRPLLNPATLCVDRDTWNRFITACAKRGVNPYEVHHVLLEDYAQLHDPKPEPDHAAVAMDATLRALP